MAPMTVTMRMTSELWSNRACIPSHTWDPMINFGRICMISFVLQYNLDIWLFKERNIARSSKPWLTGLVHYLMPTPRAANVRGASKVINVAARTTQGPVQLAWFCPAYIIIPVSFSRL